MQQNKAVRWMISLWTVRPSNVKMAVTFSCFPWLGRGLCAKPLFGRLLQQTGRKNSLYFPSTIGWSQNLFYRRRRQAGRKTSFYSPSTTDWSQNLSLATFYNRLVEKPLFGRILQQADNKTSLKSPSTTSGLQNLSLVVFHDRLVSNFQFDLL